jgi:hypothetical protein
MGHARLRAVKLLIRPSNSDRAGAGDYERTGPVKGKAPV